MTGTSARLGGAAPEMDPQTGAYRGAWRRSRQRRTVTALAAVLLILLVTASVGAAVAIARAAATGEANKLAAHRMVQAREASLAEAAAEVKTARTDETAARAYLDDKRAAASGNEQLQVTVMEARRRLSNAEDEVRNAEDEAATQAQSLAAARTAEARAAGQQTGADTWRLYTMLVVAAALVAGIAFFYVLGEKRRQFESTFVLDALDASLADRSVNALAFDQLWQTNRDRLGAYHRLIQNYASSSRQLTMVTLLSGFVFLLIVGGAALLVRNTAAAVAASVVAAAGAALAGFVGRTVLRNAATSSREVLTFFAHPLEVERMLSAERLIGRMPEDARSEALTLIIKALTRTTAGPAATTGTDDVTADEADAG